MDATFLKSTGNTIQKNGQIIYPETQPENVIDTNGFTLAHFIDKLLTVLSNGDREQLDLAFSNLQKALGTGNSLDMYIGYVNDFIDKVNTFLNDAGASEGVIDSWKEIETFLAGITDKETLTGLLADTLTSAQNYTNSKVSSATENAVTMDSNAGAANSVIVSAGANRTAKDSGVALSSLARTTTATPSANGLMSAADKTKLDGIAMNANNYRLPVATSSVLGGVKSGPDIVVGGDGYVTANNKVIPKMYKMGVNTNYKLFSILSGGDKASTTFSILSPVLRGGSGYAKYIVYRSYEGTTVKNWYPRCIYATDSTMYNRIKLVRTGDNTFDVYYQSNTGNDYCTFILDETTQTDLEIVAAGVSSIPEDIYKESEYAPVYFGDIYGSLKGNADTATKATQDGNGKTIADTYLPKTGGTMSGALTVESNVFLKSSSTTRYLQIATVNKSGAAFTSRLYVDVNAGRGAFLQFINNGVAYELGVHTDGAPRYIKDNTVYMLYHAGNLVNATTGKSGLMSATDKAKLDSLSAIARKETDIDSEVFKTPGIYVAPISSIEIDGTDTPLYGNSTIITIGNGSQAGYIEQIVIASIDDETKIFRRSWDLITGAAFEFTSLLPDIATSRTAGLVKSGNHITVSGDGTVTVTNSQKATNDSVGNNIANTYQNKTKPIPFNNSSDAINIDNYPQSDYGTIAIWFNQAEADGTPPGQEGIVYQTKYRSELGESSSTYVDCLTQLYVGSGGIKHRTVIDYDDASKFDGMAWIEPGNSPQVIPVYVYQASGYIDLTGIAAQDIDTNKLIYVKDTYGGGSGLIPLSCTRNGSTMYITFTYFDTDYGTPVIAYKQIHQTEFGKHVNLSFKEL